MSNLKISPVAEETINEIYNFNVKAFSDFQDFSWTEENIKSEIDSGWSLLSVKVEKEIICALFVKAYEGSLLTKNTPIKITHQGNGYSHEIKDFYEDYAKEHGLKRVVNFCAEDNFRMLALNESHKYEKVDSKKFGEINILEWQKELN